MWHNPRPLRYQEKTNLYQSDLNKVTLAPVFVQWWGSLFRRWHWWPLAQQNSLRPAMFKWDFLFLSSQGRDDKAGSRSDCQLSAWLWETIRLLCQVVVLNVGDKEYQLAPISHLSWSKIFLPQVHSFHSHEIGVPHPSAYNFTFIQSSPVCTQTFHPDAGSDASG